MGSVNTMRLVTTEPQASQVKEVTSHPPLPLEANQNILEANHSILFHPKAHERIVFQYY